MSHLERSPLSAHVSGSEPRLALAALDVRHRVAFWMNSRPEFLEILFGVSMLAAVASPLDYGWTKQFCPRRLTTYKRLKQFHVFEELPRTGIDKIARRLVRERVIASMAR